MNMLAQSVVNAYDFEWYHTVKEKTKKNVRTTRPEEGAPFFCRLADFPTTVNSLREFLSTYPHVAAEKLKDSGVCDSVGKFIYIYITPSRGNIYAKIPKVFSLLCSMTGIYYPHPG